MSGWVIPLAVVGIAITNVVLGYRWSRLDHNPWRGRTFGGTFATPAPGIRPADLDVGEINERGRRLMISAPIVSALFLAFYLSTQ